MNRNKLRNIKEFVKRTKRTGVVLAQVLKAHYWNQQCIVPRMTEQGSIPLVEISGNARDCGRQYAEKVLRDFPDFVTTIKRQASLGNGISPTVKKMFESQAPYLLDMHAGINDVVGRSLNGVDVALFPGEEKNKEGCTTFSAGSEFALDGCPLSGQNKDTPIGREELYILLKINIHGGVKMLSLVYPGEIFGYGICSNGMSLFSSSIYSVSRSSNPEGGQIEGDIFKLLAITSGDVAKVQEYAERFGVRGKSSSMLFSDASGKSTTIESNGDYTDVLRSRNGIVVRANHPVGNRTKTGEHYPGEEEKENSRYRVRHLFDQLNSERGRLTAQKAYMALSDHSRYPTGGVCRHIVGKKGVLNGTTASLIAEPTKGLLHVAKGNPCANFPTTYSLD